MIKDDIYKIEKKNAFKDVITCTSDLFVQTISRLKKMGLLSGLIMFLCVFGSEFMDVFMLSLFSGVIKNNADFYDKNINNNCAQNDCLKSLKPHIRYKMSQIIFGVRDEIRKKYINLDWVSALTILFYETTLWINKKNYPLLYRKVTKIHIQDFLMSNIRFGLKEIKKDYILLIYVPDLNISDKTLISNLRQHLIKANAIETLNTYRKTGIMRIILGVKKDDNNYIYIQKSLYYHISYTKKIYPLKIIKD